MIECGSVEYALARLHARHGQRPDDAAWRRIEQARGFAPLLDVARGTGLQRWLVAITADSTAHQIESALRGHWRAWVGEVAGWMPQSSRSAVAWCAALPDVAPLQHLARGDEPPGWMREDRDWRALVQADAAQRAAMLAAGPLAPLARCWKAPHAIPRAWRDEWHRRLPPPATAGATLSQLVRAVADHRQAFPQAAVGQGWMLRAALRERLTRLMRRAALDPAAAFVHLALGALELERLRAELLRRLLFPRWRAA